jgi:adenosine deaminase
VIGADDPLVFRAGLLENYAVLEASEAELADLARCSVVASTAPADVRAPLLAGIDAWLL